MLIALHLATAPPNLGPPAALLPLLRTCRALHARLGFGGNPALWGRIGRAKFARPSLAPNPHANGGNPLLHSAHTLRAHCVTLQTLRAGDPYASGAGRALIAAYALLVQDSWAAAPLAASQEGLGAFPEALRPLHATTGEGKATGMGGKNRKQLAWAGAREFAMRFVRERLYEGRYGEEEDEEDADLAWCVGWPRDTAAGAAALWVLWFFEGWDTLRAEPESARRALMALLLPFVVAPFRYPSTLCPPHHYSVPLLPAVAFAAFGPRREAITVPTLHGAYPIYPFGKGWGGRHSDGPRDASSSSRDLSSSSSDSPGEEGAQDAEDTDDSPSSGVGARRSRDSRSRSPPSRRQRGSDSPPASGSGSGSAQLLPPFRQPDSVSRRRRSRSRSPRSRRCHSPSRRPASNPRSPQHARARQSDASSSGSRSPPSPPRRSFSRQARRSEPGLARTLLTAPPARLLFFARMQAGGRMGVPPHLARDRAEAAGRWAASGGAGPQPIGPTQEDIHEKNARPIVRFERQLPGVPLPPGGAAVGMGGSGEDGEHANPCAPAASTSAGLTASPAAAPPVDPAALAAHAAARAEAEAARAVSFVEVDEDLEGGEGADGDAAAGAGRRTRGARGFVGGMGILRRARLRARALHRLRLRALLRGRRRRDPRPPGAPTNAGSRRNTLGRGRTSAWDGARGARTDWARVRAGELCGAVGGDDADALRAALHCAPLRARRRLPARRPCAR
ncbi:hypothetical protein B0H17DRAFT_562899 [Mycena rosella]|uniref:Uncharacterized protein n=1 Tax=Mycena rosella TaxID=1033263 RepID=A0AAD7BPH1_MYCRO|nr:hypothetical protein B0H17DRAFT_562899 [Mycena rosella]